MSTRFPIDSFQPITLAEMQGVKLMNRIDTKYIIPVALLPELLGKCAGSFFLQEAAGNRISGYRTLYYDTPKHESYLLHLHGHAPRQKLRARIYEDTGDAFFEIKDKTNKGRTKKKRVEIPHDCFRDFASSPDALTLAEKKSRWDYRILSPSIDIQFSRLTLVNKGMTERVTIDTDLTFTNSRNGNSSTLPQIAVIELKRDGRQHSLMQDLLLEMRVFPAKFSKYCTGLMMTDPDLPKGRFKIRLIELNKIIAKYA